MHDTLNPYPAYTPSGVPWLGDVPAHWEVLPHRAIFMEVNDQGHPDEQMLSVTIAEGIIRQQTLLEGSAKKDASRLDRSAYKLVRPGDIAYNKMRAWQGAIGVSDYRGIVSPAYSCGTPPRAGLIPASASSLPKGRIVQPRRRRYPYVPDSWYAAETSAGDCKIRCLGHFGVTDAYARKDRVRRQNVSGQK